MFEVLAQRDEIAKLKIQEDRQTRENLEAIKGGTCASIDAAGENKPSFRLRQRSGEQSGRLQKADPGQDADAWLQHPEDLQPVSVTPPPGTLNVPPLLNVASFARSGRNYGTPQGRQSHERGDFEAPEEECRSGQR